MLLSSVPDCIAGLVPTPPAGTGTPVTVPAPNPLQYNAVSGAVISSQQFNSNFWKSYNDINAIATALNTCAYSTGTGVTSVAATSPIVGTIGSCSPGAGTTLTLSMASNVPYSGTYFTASSAHIGDYRWPGDGAIAGDVMGLDDDSTGSVNGVTCDAFRFTDFTIPKQLVCGDDAGNVGALGSYIGTTINSRPSGTTYTVPFDANSLPGDASAHTESSVFIAGTLSGGACVTSPVTTYTLPFTALPWLSYSIVGNGFIVVNTATSSTSQFAARACNVGGSSTGFSVSYFASGE